MILDIKKLGIMKLSMIIKIRHKASIVMLNVAMPCDILLRIMMPSVVKLSVIMLRVIMLSKYL